MEHAKACQRPISLGRRLAATYLVTGLVTAGLAGCAAGPDFQRPTAPDVARYTATPVADRTASAPTQFGETQRLVEGLPIETQWWQSLDSSAVDGLIDEAFHVSPTLASISANLRQAQELLAAQRRRKIMLLLGAETLGMTHNQCLELLESAEDTLDFLISSLTYLIHAENQQAHAALIAEWDALDQEVFEVQHTLPGSDVETYRLVIETCAQRNRELRPVVDRYMAK